MNTIDYVVGSILLIFLVLAIRATFLKKDNCGSSCGNCPYSSKCKKQEKNIKEQ